MENRPICAVCHQPIEGEAFTLGRRTYDATHFARLARENKAAAGPLLIEVGAVVIFVAIVALLAGALKSSLTQTGWPLC